MVGEPTALGVYETPQLPLASVQLVALRVPVEPLALQLTVPVGVVGVPKRSATVAVHVDATPNVTGFGAHTTVVDVAWAAATVMFP
jgi:hypothetical protein